MIALNYDVTPAIKIVLIVCLHCRYDIVATDNGLLVLPARNKYGGGITMKLHVLIIKKLIRQNFGITFYRHLVRIYHIFTFILILTCCWHCKVYSLRFNCRFIVCERTYIFFLLDLHILCIIKQLYNSVIACYEELSRPRFMLSSSAFG